MNHMKDLITAILVKQPKLTAREIAKTLGIEKKEVNAFLYQNQDIFSQDDEPYRVCRRVNILRDYPDDKTKLYPRN